MRFRTRWATRRLRPRRRSNSVVALCRERWSLSRPRLKDRSFSRSNAATPSPRRAFAACRGGVSRTRRCLDGLRGRKRRELRASARAVPPGPHGHDPDCGAGDQPGFRIPEPVSEAFALLPGVRGLPCQPGLHRQHDPSPAGRGGPAMVRAASGRCLALRQVGRGHAGGRILRTYEDCGQLQPGSPGGVVRQRDRRKARGVADMERF